MFGCGRLCRLGTIGWSGIMQCRSRLCLGGLDLDLDWMVFVKVVVKSVDLYIVSLLQTVVIIQERYC